MTLAIFIDAKHATCTTVDVQGLKTLQALVEGYIESAPMRLRSTLYVNEEGLLRQLPYGFTFAGHGPFYGNGVLIGPPNVLGEDTPCKLNLTWVMSKVEFHTFKYTQVQVVGKFFRL